MLIQTSSNKNLVLYQPHVFLACCLNPILDVQKKFHLFQWCWTKMVEPSPDLSAREKRSHLAWMYLWIAFPTSSSRSSAHHLKNWKTTAHIILKFFVWIGKLPCNSVCKVREKSLFFSFPFAKLHHLYSATY